MEINKTVKLWGKMKLRQWLVFTTDIMFIKAVIQKFLIVAVMIGILVSNVNKGKSICIFVVNVKQLSGY